MASLSTTLFAIAITPATMIGAGPALSATLTPVPHVAKTDVILRRELAPTEFRILLDADTPPDPLGALRDAAIKYAGFADGWDGPGSLAASPGSRDAALVFIDGLPLGLPLPGIMISPEGEIGFYWDLGGGYADISFSENGRGSFFSRTTSAEEEYIENLDPSALKRQWFFERLGAMSAPVLDAA